MSTQPLALTARLRAAMAPQAPAGRACARPASARSASVAPLSETTGPATAGLGRRLNWLRAGVLGANDGIVSVAAVVVGVAGASTSTGPILAAGTAAVIGGAVSMALGEYVSVSSQSDSEKAVIAAATARIGTDPEAGLEELTAHWQDQGLSAPTARRAAREMLQRDPIRAHLSMSDVDPEDVVSPWHAAFASFLSFFVGALLPMLAILLPPPGLRIPVTMASTLLALALTGVIAAGIGGSSRRRAAVRVVIGGALALAVTYGAGTLLGSTGLGI